MAYKRSRSERTDNGRLFECKTCYKQFPSFQALGGHRTSHKRGVRERSEEAMKTERRTKKVHGCPVCGLQFSMGQALGGHMTKHRRQEHDEDKKDEKREAVVLFDLNLPPRCLDQFFWDVPMYEFF